MSRDVRYVFTSVAPVRAMGGMFDSIGPLQLSVYEVCVDPESNALELRYSCIPSEEFIIAPGDVCVGFELFRTCVSNGDGSLEGKTRVSDFCGAMGQGLLGSMHWEESGIVRTAQIPDATRVDAGKGHLYEIQARAWHRRFPQFMSSGPCMTIPLPVDILGG